MDRNEVGERVREKERCSDRGKGSEGEREIQTERE